MDLQQICHGSKTGLRLHQNGCGCVKLVHKAIRNPQSTHFCISHSITGLISGWNQLRIVMSEFFRQSWIHSELPHFAIVPRNFSENSVQKIWCSSKKWAWLRQRLTRSCKRKDVGNKKVLSFCEFYGDAKRDKFRGNFGEILNI
ncbi:hypothetical protein XENTR_v10016555 [Xenopus tropicalis]|nr:hypothetical protein XENTR_v10016555 [Xenopus tropicalis]KAE8597662.1 hypothetical protein XENTR_v10016555 [Xenopus tropicalis]